MRKVEIGSEKYTQVFAIDEPHKINKANHKSIHRRTSDGKTSRRG